MRVLVTSRESLRLTAEHEFPLSPLALPDLRSALSAPELAHVGAVALFVQRARAIRPDFLLNAANAPAVSEICARLDGLPLGIELAAARIKLLPPGAILARLAATPLELLSGGARDLPARQQTLRNAIGWSYDLLDPAEQRLFRRLGVFSGGCTLEAAAQLCHLPGDVPMDVFSRVTSLTNKSLLLPWSQPDGERDAFTLGEIGRGHSVQHRRADDWRSSKIVDHEPRLAMLETIREFAREQLTLHGELEPAERAHGAYYLAFAERAAPELTGPDQVMWLERLAHERDNLRSALRRALHERDNLRLSAALWRFWFARGDFSEGRRWLEAALALGGETVPGARMLCLNGLAVLAINQGDYARVEAWCTESLQLARQGAGGRPAPSAGFAEGIVVRTAMQQAGNLLLADRAREAEALSTLANSLFGRAIMGAPAGYTSRA